MNRDRHQGIVNQRIAKAVKRTIEEHCERTKDTAKLIAEECGIHESTLSNYANGVAGVPVDVAATIMRVTNINYIGQEFARLMGVMWIPAPTSDIDCVAVGDSITEFGQFVTQFGAAMADGNVTAEEAIQIEREGVEAMEKIQSLIKTAQTKSKELRTVAIKGAM